ncbi:MAG: Gfo/Idh/MocA family protein [Sciscionella sp.]
MSMRTPTARPRIALIGTGSMGSLHARVIAGAPRCALVRVVEPRQEEGQQVAERFGAKWVPELDSVRDVDAVVLASSTETHRDLALQVLEQGVPVLIEKPVSADLAAIEEVVALAAAKDVPLMCGLVERFNPAVLTALALASEPVHVLARRHGPYASRIRTGVAWDLLVHDVDLAIRCFGGLEPTQVVSGVGHFHPYSAPGAEDVMETTLSFPTGGLATVSASRIGQRKLRTLTISEVERLIEVDLVRRDVTIYRHVSHDAVTPDGLGYRQQTVIEIPELVTGGEPLAAQLEHFLDLVSGQADATRERDSILPPHRVVGAALAGS